LNQLCCVGRHFADGLRVYLLHAHGEIMYSTRSPLTLSQSLNAHMQGVTARAPLVVFLPAYLVKILVNFGHQILDNRA